MIIPERFNGPAGTGNGGYSSGLIAAEFAAPSGSAVEVTLRVPPPLDTELTVERDDPGAVVRRGDTLVASARPGTVDDLVPAVPYEVAESASRDYPGFTSHPFPTCYSCGTERPDGLRVFPGRLADGRTAAPFVVPEDVTPATIWAALDCPGGWTVDVEARPYVLGRITARLAGVPAAGTRCVVTGKLLGRDGRKAHVATTVWAPEGRPLGIAKATWIALPDQ
ncbi:MAG: hypothetical protein ACRDUA_15940 [Micromonosporaceae bacterium]